MWHAAPDFVQAAREARAAGAPVAGACAPVLGGLTFVGAVPTGIDHERLASEPPGGGQNGQHLRRRRLASVGVPTIELHGDGAVRIGPVRAPPVVQAAGGRVQVAVEAAEQHCGQAQTAGDAHAMAERPVVEAARDHRAVHGRRHIQRPVARPQDLAQAGRARRVQGDVGLELEAGLARPRFQMQRRITGPVPHLRLVRPRAGKVQQPLHRLVHGAAERERGGDRDIGAGPVMTQHGAAAQHAGRAVDREHDLGAEWKMNRRQQQPQGERVRLVPGRDPPGDRLPLGADGDHGGFRGRLALGRRGFIVGGVAVEQHRGAAQAQMIPARPVRQDPPGCCGVERRGGQSRQAVRRGGRGSAGHQVSAIDPVSHADGDLCGRAMLSRCHPVWP